MAENQHKPSLVLRPPQKLKRMMNRQGGHVHCKMSGVLMVAESSVASRVSTEPDTRSSVLSFSLGIYNSKNKAKRVKMALMWLAFSINSHQTLSKASRKCSCLLVHFLPDPSSF